ncbi:TonB-dependent receptor [Pedobacter sp. UBA4863]|uniref:SusC/RagA family TonB-linked outer membrane protein n=1 Tax=Pedobacter sp. UBA4863 TaxID=1947060 RepID=UPI0025F2AE55|nr:TonB-dependent receptor [Pedobacter sp. UBA4863]
MKKIFTELSVITCFLLLLISDVAYAQNVTVKGTVKDDRNLPIPGVSIVLKGTNNGVQTDAIGNYTISVPSNGTLVFSSIGFNNQETLVNNRTTINITLLPSTNDLQQIVVIGYGTQKKRDLTGSITSIKGKEIEKLPNVNPVSSLQGQVAGLTIVNSGSPGAAPTVRIRGIASTNSNSVNPLYVVDGVHQSNIDYINPADIESIEVLKDASSAAIFGLQAANGVIVVTTKRAKTGTTTINLASSAGFQKIQKTIDVLNAAQFRTVYDKIRANANAIPFDYTNYTADTDWQNEMLRTAFQTNHGLTISNSSEKSTTLLSLGYNNQEGVLKFGKYQRYTARLNEEIRITKDIKIGGDFTGSHWNLNGSGASLNNALWAAPIVGIRESETAYYAMPSFQRSQVGNPIASIYQNDKTSINKGYRFVGSLFGEVKFLEKFTWKSQVYTDLGFNNSRGYTPISFTQVLLGEFGQPTEYYNNPNARTSVRQAAEEFRKFQQDHTLTYSDKIGGHSFTGLVGLTTIHESSTSLSGSRTDTRLFIPNDPDLWYVGIVDPDNPTTLGGGGANRSSVGAFARANYAYKERYLINASIRRDGISRLSPQNRWGTFGSLGLGWVVSEENFFKNIKGIDFLKLRGAWGSTGNASGIADFIYLPGLNTGGSGVFGDFIYPSVAPDYLPDRNLRWESNRGLDMGFDLKALNNKLSAEVVYYDRKAKDIITSITLPGSTGVTRYITNAGTISNKGLEVALGWTDNITKNLKYSISPNFSYNKNEVTSIGDKIDFLLTGNGTVNRTVTGQSVGHFYGYRQAGIYQTVSQIENSPTLAGVLPGDIMYQDINKDGKIDEKDMENLGSPFPSWNYGINFSLSYKNFDFLVQGQGVAGNYIYTQRRVVTFTDANLETNRLNAWDGAGTSNIEPILDKGRSGNYRFSTYFLEPGDYFRLRTLQLGYTYKPKNTTGMMLKSLRMYLSGQNLYTWSKVSGYTPEVPIGNVLGGGADNGTYPIPAVYTFGINVTF